MGGFSTFSEKLEKSTYMRAPSHISEIGAGINNMWKRTWEIFRKHWTVRRSAQISSSVPHLLLVIVLHFELTKHGISRSMDFIFFKDLMMKRSAVGSVLAVLLLTSAEGSAVRFHRVDLQQA